MIDASEILSVIFEQERTIYKCDDYLSAGFHAIHRVEHPNDSSQQHDSSSSAAESSNSSASSSVDETWRGLICEWSFQVVDHFDFNRETVAISLSYLDRFVASRPLNRRTFQLAAMTTLYLAIKLFEPGHLKVSDLVKLSQGCFVPEHIVMMEESILR
jgi:lipoyl(octanoyl) transferase